MSEETKKTEAESGAGSIQRREDAAVEKLIKLKDETRKIIRSIREGHGTGGYCESDKLKAAEKILHRILTQELALAKAKHGYSPDPKFKHPEIRAIEVELYGLSWKPELVVKE